MGNVGRAQKSTAYNISPTGIKMCFSVHIHKNWTEQITSTNNLNQKFLPSENMWGEVSQQKMSCFLVIIIIYIDFLAKKNFSSALMHNKHTFSQ